MNYTPLVLLNTHGFLEHFIAVLIRESKTLRVPTPPKTHILCLCILCCKTYCFNSSTVTAYNDTMVGLCWQRIERSVRYMIMSYGMSESLSYALLKGRSYEAYRSISNIRDSEVIVSMTKTPHSVLNSRQSLIESTAGGRVITSIVYGDLNTKFLGPRVYRSLYQCIASHANLGDVSHGNPIPVECNDSKVPFIYSDCKRLGTMSVKHGLDRPSNILLKTDMVWTELHDDQPMSPLGYIDNSAHLDPLVESEFMEVMRMYGYNTSTSLLANTTLPIMLESDEYYIIKQSRQCLSFGSIMNNTELIRVWMVRPTINYSTYVVEVNTGNRFTIANQYVSRFRSLTNYGPDDLSIECPLDEPNHIVISGTMAHYHILKTGIKAKMKNVSLGGSVIRVHQIKDFTSSPKVVDICINMSILKSLARGSRTDITPEIFNNYVKFKYHTNKAKGLGPTLIIGRNGGFQWTGSPSNIAESMLALFAFMSSNIRTKSFIEAVSASSCMIKYIYPSGVARTKSNEQRQLSVKEPMALFKN